MNQPQYLLERFAKAVGRAEEQAFVAGTGSKIPTGIVSPDKDAEVAFTVKELGWDEITKLYFSLSSSVSVREDAG